MKKENPAETAVIAIANKCKQKLVEKGTGNQDKCSNGAIKKHIIMRLIFFI